MKKILALFATCLLALGSSKAATLTLSNQNTASNGAYGVADSTGALYSGTGVLGVMGRMTISDAAITAAYATGNIAAISAGFQPFDPATGTFALNSLGASGAFETSKDYDTRASANSFGGSAIYVWIYKGTTRANATEHLIVKLSAPSPPTQSQSRLPGRRASTCGLPTSR